MLLLQQANKQRSSNFQFRNTDDSICNNDKSLCFSPSRIAFPTGTTNNSSLPMAQNRKAFLYRTVFRQKFQATSKTNAHYSTQLPANTVSSSYLTNKNHGKSTEHKTKKHFRLLPCFSAETTTNHTETKQTLARRIHMTVIVWKQCFLW